MLFFLSIHVNYVCIELFPLKDTPLNILVLTHQRPKLLSHRKRSVGLLYMMTTLAFNELRYMSHVIAQQDFIGKRF